MNGMNDSISSMSEISEITSLTFTPVRVFSNMFENYLAVVRRFQNL